LQQASIVKARLPPFEEIEHTADLRLRVYGCGLSELFCHAALGMFHLMQCRPMARSSSVSYPVLIESGDAETLLVDWLNEVLYLGERDQACFTIFEISHLEVGDAQPNRLEAIVRGKSHCPPNKGIKAVTFHALEITRHESGAYQVTITFDV
jgi:SHS2 domain-containing protein